MRALEVQLKKLFKGLRKTREVLGRTEENSVSLTRGHSYLPPRQINYYFLNKKQTEKTWLLLVARPEETFQDVWVDSRKVETAGEFSEEGAETHFTVDNQPAFIRTVSSGNRYRGVIQTLIVGNVEVPEYKEIPQ